MFQRFWERRENEEGFTLIELMVVVLIIGILIAIALPTFLGARTRAQNRAAQSDLRNALVAAKTIYTDTSTYTCATGGAAGTFAGTCTQNLASVEPSLTYVVDVAVANGDGVSVTVAATTWAAARMSASGTCYWIKDFASGPGTRYGSTTDATKCTGTDANGLLATSAASFP